MACASAHLPLLLLLLAAAALAGRPASAVTGPWPSRPGLAGYGGLYRGGYHGEDMTRRVLGSTSTYISYAALTADSVPCSTAGISYYDCSSSGAANPYTRSCTTITLCARDTS